MIYCDCGEQMEDDFLDDDIMVCPACNDYKDKAMLRELGQLPNDKPSDLRAEPQTMPEDI